MLQTATQTNTTAAASTQTAPATSSVETRSTSTQVEVGDVPSTADSRRHWGRADYEDLVSRQEHVLHRGVEAMERIAGRNSALRHMINAANDRVRDLTQRNTDLRTVSIRIKEARVQARYVAGVLTCTMHLIYDKMYVITH